MVTRGTYNFVFIIVKIILLELPIVLSLPAAAKTQCFVHLCFKSTLQLINGILSDLQNYLDILMAQQLLHFLEFHQLDSKGAQQLRFLEI